MLAKHKVYFQDPKSSKGRDGIPFDGVPFIITGRKQYDCQHGVDRHAREKKKKKYEKFKVCQDTLVYKLGGSKLFRQM